MGMEWVSSRVLVYTLTRKVLDLEDFSIHITYQLFLEPVPVLVRVPVIGTREIWVFISSLF